MRITTQADYGLSCILNLAKKYGHGPVNIREIAREERLPKDYLEQLLRRLRRAGIVKSIRGTGGGYILAKRPNKISVKDVIVALERDVFELICSRSRRKNSCVHIHECGIRPIWIKLKKNIERTLKNSNIELLLQKETKVKRSIDLNEYR